MKNFLVRRVIDMTIDEAIAHEKRISKDNKVHNFENIVNYHEQIAEWLGELKEARHCMEENRKAGYNHGFVDGYDKAIDDFAILMKETLNLAEQLKVGKSE